MDELIAAATALAEADEAMMYLLVKARKDAGLTQRAVADALGIKQSSVAAFERHDNDPRLSTIRRYALAVGASVEHRVSCASWTAADHGWAIKRSDISFSTGHRVGAPQFPAPAPVGVFRTDFETAA